MMLAVGSIFIFRPQIWEKIGNKAVNAFVYMKGVVAPIETMPTPASRLLDSNIFLETLQSSAGISPPQMPTSSVEMQPVTQLPAYQPRYY
jgi:hypothetical protein